MNNPHNSVTRGILLGAISLPALFISLLGGVYASDTAFHRPFMAGTCGLWLIFAIVIAGMLLAAGVALGALVGAVLKPSHEALRSLVLIVGIVATATGVFGYVWETQNYQPPSSEYAGCF